jgi:peroxiredoxin Q/BCP
MRLSAGDPAPDFDLLDHTGSPVALSDYRGRKLVIYFYPKAFTPG